MIDPRELTQALVDDFKAKTRAEADVALKGQLAAQVQQLEIRLVELDDENHPAVVRWETMVKAIQEPKKVTKKVEKGDPVAETIQGDKK